MVYKVDEGELRKQVNNLIKLYNFRGLKPISFVWELHEEIHPKLINKANKSIII